MADIDRERFCRRIAGEVRAMRTLCIRLASLLLASTVPARAGTPVVYCADDAVGVQFSLTVAQDNGLDDVIRLVGGNYALSAVLIFSTAEANTLDISGGWNAVCSQQSGDATILDGGGAFSILDVDSSAPSFVHVARITFIDG
jgi:hypothetical protein